MHPEICKIGPFTIYSYGAMFALAFLVGSGLAVLAAKKKNIDPEIIFDLSFVALVSGVLGARLLYILENTAYYFRNPLEIVMLQRGGLSFFGGLTAAIIAAVAYLKKRRSSVYEVFDLVAPFLALGQAIGRIGCLLNGCCFGRESGFGIYFPVHQAVLIPTQIYSSLGLILIFLVLRFLEEKPHKTGGIFFAYLLLYSVMRFFIEFWRADNAVILFGLTLFQLISIAVFVISAVKLFFIRGSSD